MATGFSVGADAGAPEAASPALPHDPQLAQPPSLPPPHPGDFARLACTRPSRPRQRWGR